MQDGRCSVCALVTAALANRKCHRRAAHPFHIHQIHFLAFAANGTSLNQLEWLDTVNVANGNGTVDLIMDFEDSIIKGMSLFHCHLLKQRIKGWLRFCSSETFGLRDNGVERIWVGPLPLKPSKGVKNSDIQSPRPSSIILPVLCYRRSLGRCDHESLCVATDPD